MANYIHNTLYMYTYIYTYMHNIHIITSNILKFTLKIHLNFSEVLGDYVQEAALMSQLGLGSGPWTHNAMFLFLDASPLPFQIQFSFLHC